MKNVPSVAKMLFVLLVAVCIFQACGPKSGPSVKTTPFAVVRGSDLRSDEFTLPLEKENKAIEKLLNYVKIGGDKKNEDTGIVADFYDEVFYTDLLNLLAADMDKDGFFEMEDLFDDVEGERTLKENVAKHFTKPIIYSIFDSRKERPDKRSIRPFALKDKDGNMLWLFYREKVKDKNDGKVFIRCVMAMVPISRDLKHFEK